MSIKQLEFETLYLSFLVVDMDKSPERYHYSKEKAPDVARTMVESMKNGCANVNSPAIKATCKTLGIKPTLTAIKEHLNS